FTSTAGETLPSAFSTSSSALPFFSLITSIAPYTMRSATDFLPLFMTMLMKRAIVSLLCFGSGSTARCGVFPLRDMSCSSGLRTLGAVLGTRLPALGDAGGVERAAQRGAPPRSRRTAGTPQVLGLAADVRHPLVTVGQAHLGHSARRRDRLLRGGGVPAGAHAPALRAVGQRGRLALVNSLAARLADQ